MNYRVYETIRNTGGGLDSVGTDWEHVEASNAQDAADEWAEVLRDNLECVGLTVIATDDDGDSAQCDV